MNMSRKDYAFLNDNEYYRLFPHMLPIYEGGIESEFSKQMRKKLGMNYYKDEFKHEEE
tara:strand:- start:187 stop:360 length:174 start_codon:yes stop_codon:yes gene_type:complete